MGQYTIADLEKLSGIKAHTIRIWEQRYGLLKPRRTPTNIRYYDDDQLRKLLNVSSLLRNGVKISHIGSMSEEEIYSRLDTLPQNSQPEGQFELFINQLVHSGLSFNESQFEKSFSSAILRFGLKDTYIKVIYPLLERLGLMWGKEELNPAQEHFVSNLIKQKLFTAIDGLATVASSQNSYVLFLPEGEDHEIGLLFASYLLKANQLKVIYLGQSVPFKNLEDTIQFSSPTHLMTFFVRSQSIEEAQEYIVKLSTVFPDKKIILSGNQWIIDKIKLSSNINPVRTVEEFIQLIK